MKGKKPSYYSLIVTFACIIFFTVFTRISTNIYYNLKSLNLIDGSLDMLFPICFGLMIIICVLRFYLIYKYPRRRYRNNLHDDSHWSADRKHSDEWVYNQYERTDREEGISGYSTDLDYCSFCGAEIDNTFIYCPKCGKLIR